MTKLAKYSGKEWRVIGGHKFRFVRAARLRRDANVFAKAFYSFLIDTQDT